MRLSGVLLLVISLAIGFLLEFLIGIYMIATTDNLFTYRFTAHIPRVKKVIVSPDKQSSITITEHRVGDPFDPWRYVYQLKSHAGTKVISDCYAYDIPEISWLDNQHFLFQLGRQKVIATFENPKIPCLQGEPYVGQHE